MSRRMARRASTAWRSFRSCASTRSSRGLPGNDADEQSRFIEGVFSVTRADGRPTALRVASIYLPNGNPVGTDKFAYKLEWMARLHDWARQAAGAGGAAGDRRRLQRHPRAGRRPLPRQWVDDALYQPQSRQAFRRLANLGFTDALRAVDDTADIFTFWDYQAGAWQKNNGIRIDHLMLSPEAADGLASASIDKHVRAWEKPSDHVPALAALAFEAA